MRRFFNLALVLAGAFLLVPAARAQFTTVTATIQDPNGIPYAGAVLNAVLVPSVGGGYTLGGQPYSGRIGPVTLDSTGSFTVNFGDVTLITPGSPQWQITIDSAAATINPAIGTGPQSFTYTSSGTTISGSSPVSLTAALNALAPRLTNFTTGGTGASPSSSASANVAAIQASLNQTGTVSINQCGTYNLNGPLTIPSNTTLLLSPCATLFQVSGTVNNILVNSAFTRRGFVSTGPTVSSGGTACTNGTQNVTFTNGTGTGAFGTVLVAGNVPTGPVTITNGGSFYQAVPTQGTVATCTGTTTFTGGAVNVGGATSVTLSCTSGTTVCTGTWGGASPVAHGFTAGTSYVSIFSNNTADHAYIGNFVVESTPTSTTFTFRTRTIPVAAPAGTFTGLVSDVKIWIESGQLNYNYAGNTAGNGATTGMTIMLFACANCWVRNSKFVNPTQDNIFAAFMTDGGLDRLSDSGSATNSPRQMLKSVGPLYDWKVQNIVHFGNDDCVTMMNAEGSNFGSVVLSYGDIINSGFTNIDCFNENGNGSSGLVVLFFAAPFYDSGWYARDITGVVNGVLSGGIDSLPTACVVLKPINANANVDSAVIENVNGNCSWGVQVHAGSVAAAYSVNSLTINKVTCNQTNTAGGKYGQICIQLDDTGNVWGTVNTMVIRDTAISSQVNTSAQGYIDIAGTVGNLIIEQPSDVALGGGAPGNVFTFESTSTIKNAVFSGAYSSETSTGNALGTIVAGATVGQITIRDCYVNAQALLLVNATTIITLDGCNLSTMSAGVIRANGTITITVHARNTILNAGQWGAVAGGSPTFNWYHEVGNSGVALSTSVPTGFVIKTLACDGLTLTTSLISTHFGTGDSLSGNPCAFKVTVGTSPGVTGAITFPFPATASWNCPLANNTRGSLTQQTGADSTTVATFTNFSAVNATTTANFTAGDVLLGSCAPR